MKKFKLNPKKILIIITFIVLIITSILLIDSTLNPIKYTSGIANESGFKQIVTKRDFVSPTLTILFSDNPCPSDRSDIKEFEYLIAHPKRQMNGLYLAEDNIFGISKCEYLSEFLEIVKTKDLSLESENPNFNKFRNSKIKSSKNSQWNYLNKSELDRYFSPVDTENSASKEISDYQKLKVGMKYDLVEKIIGDCDMGLDMSEKDKEFSATKQDHEMICVVKSKGINFIALGWSSSPILYQKSQGLINAWIVYDNRRMEEIKLEQLR